mmetsp:Transcript_13837/g.34808  ORF Transcript_13837/g.34808 Transcript_13837/m.34808 type:complete len:225 (-) Transcript_13837:116-790(-)
MSTDNMTITYSPLWKHRAAKSMSCPHHSIASSQKVVVTSSERPQSRQLGLLLLSGHQQLLQGDRSLVACRLVRLSPGLLDVGLDLRCNCRGSGLRAGCLSLRCLQSPPHLRKLCAQGIGLERGRGVDGHRGRNGRRHRRVGLRGRMPQGFQLRPESRNFFRQGPQALHLCTEALGLGPVPLHRLTRLAQLLCRSGRRRRGARGGRRRWREGGEEGCRGGGGRGR